MKRTLVFLLLAAMLLTGCQRFDDSEDSVTFYYLRSQVIFGSEDSVIAPEEREIAVGSLPLSELLNLYLQGPASETLLLPLPDETRLDEVREDAQTITLVFSRELSNLEGMELSIACACISYTCFSLTDAQTVHIEAPSEDMHAPLHFTVTRDTFLLFDDTTLEAEAS